MKKLLIVTLCILLSAAGQAQDKRHDNGKQPMNRSLPGLSDCLQAAQQNLSLYLDGQANDVNSIVKEIELYIDSIPNSHRGRTYSDVLLVKYFDPLRHFFLTTTNKTSVAADFLYTGMPFGFCMRGDTALTLCIHAVKDHDSYNLGKTTEKRIAQLALTNCLLPSLAALDSFRDSDIKYVALSIYYGCKDPRDGAPKVGAIPYCLILVARMADVQQFAAGLITGKGLLANAELYLADADGMHEIKTE